MNKLIKVMIGGKEYAVTDKQAQQILDVISNKVETLEGNLDKLE